MELFLSWKAMKRHREVIIFSAGLVKNPRPLINYLYEMQVQNYLSEMRTGLEPSIDADLFKSIISESQLPDHPLHNQFINHYHHSKDDRRNRPCDTTPIYFPSRVYHFRKMKQAVVLENHLSAAAQTPNCAMYIWNPDEATTRDLLQICSEIFKQQPVTDLFMLNVTCRDSSLTVPRMINPESLDLRLCFLPLYFVRSLIQQLFGTGDSLQLLRLLFMDLSPSESLLDELLENLVAHHEVQKGQRKMELELKGHKIWNKPTNLSEDFKVKWRKPCEGVESADCDIWG